MPNQLCYRKRERSYRYAVDQPFSYKSKYFDGLNLETPFIKIKDSVIYIKDEYAWDGASGAFDTPSIMIGSLVHDALYQLMRLGLLPLSFRKKADKVFRVLCRKCRMRWFRARYIYKTVRKVGEFAATHDQDEDKVICVPLGKRVTVNDRPS